MTILNDNYQYQINQLKEDIVNYEQDFNKLEERANRYGFSEKLSLEMDKLFKRLDLIIERRNKIIN